MDKVTIVDLAKKLCVAPSTVSRALHNHPDISKPTKKAVSALAQKMRYRPNILAQSLKRQRSNTIGVIVPEIIHEFFSRVISGIEGIASDNGYVIILCESSEDYEREILNARVLVDHRVAGLLVSITQNTSNFDHFIEIQNSGMPIVFFDRVCNETNVSKVVADDYKGGFLATEHLIKKGYKHIGHIGGRKDLVMAQNRLKGFLDAHNKYNINITQELIIHGGLHEVDGKNGINYLLSLKLPPDAVFAFNDPIAMGVYDEVYKRGLKIPKDLAIIGFSNNPIARYVYPKLTTIHQPGVEMGQIAAKILIDQIRCMEEDKILKPQNIILDTKLIIREST